MFKTQFKKIIIIFVYLIIFALLAWWIGSWIYDKYYRPNPCFDGIRNQNEEDVDCGGVCKKACVAVAKYDLKVASTGFMDSGLAGKYDVYGEVNNPNSDFGSKEFKYIFTIKDAAGQTIATKTGENFILPGETKYIVENNVETAAVPGSIELLVSDPVWVEFVGYERPQLKIVNKSYNEIGSGIGFSEAVGLLKNDSPFDFSVINIKVILKDDKDQVLALNSTEMRTVKTGENREFRAFWPSRFPGSVSNMEVQPEVNVFDSDAFARRFFKTQKFQESQQ